MTLLIASNRSVNRGDLIVAAHRARLHQRPHYAAGCLCHRRRFLAELNHGVEGEATRSLVSDEQNGRAALQLIDGARELLAGVGIERAGGLIEDQYGGLLEQRSRD